MALDTQLFLTQAGHSPVASDQLAERGLISRFPTHPASLADRPEASAACAPIMPTCQKVSQSDSVDLRGRRTIRSAAAEQAAATNSHASLAHAGWAHRRAARAEGQKGEPCLSKDSVGEPPFRWL